MPSWQKFAQIMRQLCAKSGVCKSKFFGGLDLASPPNQKWPYRAYCVCPNFFHDAQICPNYARIFGIKIFTRSHTWGAPERDLTRIKSGELLKLIYLIS